MGHVVYLKLNLGKKIGPVAGGLAGLAPVL